LARKDCSSSISRSGNGWGVDVATVRREKIEEEGKK